MLIFEEALPLPPRPPPRPRPPGDFPLGVKPIVALLKEWISMFIIIFMFVFVYR